MAVDYLQLVYLAEFAAAFNLAFGEFKQKEQTDKLEKYNETFFNTCNGLFAEKLNHKPDPLHEKSLLAKNILRIQVFCEKQKTLGADYKPFNGFFERAKIFSYTPDYKFSWKQFYKYPYYFISGCLASWGYSKTALWKYKPCSKSISAWLAVALIALCFLGMNCTNFKNFTNELCCSLSNSIYVLLGFIVTALVLRPLFSLVTLLFNISETKVRAQYYPKILLFIVTSILLFITIRGHLPVAPEHLKYWWFLLGMLSCSVVYPLALSISYEIIDDRMNTLVGWINEYGEEASNKLIDGKLNPEISSGV